MLCPIVRIWPSEDNSLVGTGLLAAVEPNTCNIYNLDLPGHLSTLPQVLCHTMSLDISLYLLQALYTHHFQATCLGQTSSWAKVTLSLGPWPLEDLCLLVRGTEAFPCPTLRADSTQHCQAGSIED